MSDSPLNNKTIAKNTMMLYVRMILTLGVNLYTSRIILQVLGIDDYGLYTVVAGVIVLFSFLNGALTQATQRFLSFELGKGNRGKYKEIFNLSILVYLGLSLIIIILGETVGLWFLNTHLNIAADKMVAANWVYQFTILTFFLNMMYTPYNAAIISHEKMSFYAYVSIIEVVLKLLIVYLLLLIAFDKLITYSVLLSVVSFIVLFIYIFYCTHKFEECRFSLVWNKELFTKLISFSSWTMFGSLSVIATTQGVNILLNIFFGVALNAAMGITNQVSNAVNQLVVNFQTAFNPQITKSYANKDRDYCESLVFRSAKVSYLLLLLLALPFIIKTDMILHLWLENVPPFTVSFCRLAILSLLIDSLSGPLWMLIQANGRIRNYQLIIGSLFFINLLLSYLLFSLGFGPLSAMVVRCIVCCLLLATRLYIFVSMLNFPSLKFCRQVLLRMLIITLVALPLPLLVNSHTTGVWSLLMTTLTSIVSILCLSYFIALNSDERTVLKNIISEKIRL